MVAPYFSFRQHPEPGGLVDGGQSGGFLAEAGDDGWPDFAGKAFAQAAHGFVVVELGFYFFSGHFGSEVDG